MDQRGEGEADQRAGEAAAADDDDGVHIIEILGVAAEKHERDDGRDARDVSKTGCNVHRILRGLENRREFCRTSSKA